MTVPTKIVPVPPEVEAALALEGLYLALEGLYTAITDEYGERCPEHEDRCPVCEAWKVFDSMCGLFELDPTEAHSAANSWASFVIY